MTPFKKGIFSFIALAVILSVGTLQPTFARPAAQDDSAVRTVIQDRTGAYSFIGIDSTRLGTALPKAAFAGGGQPTAATALADITAYAREFGLRNAGQETQFMKSSATSSGAQSFRYQQVYQGIPVVGGEIIANYDARGRLAALSGQTSPNISVTTTPRLSAQQAGAKALAYVSRETSVPASQLTYNTPVLSIYDSRLLTPDVLPVRLVWRLEVKPVQLLPVRYLVLVDANTGGIALAFNQVDTAWTHAVTPRAGTQPVAALLGVIPFRPLQQGGLHFPNPAGTTYDSHNTASLAGAGFSEAICNTVPTALNGPGSCRNATVPTNNLAQFSANAAQYFAYVTENYYDINHNRNSINNAGMALISNVNYREVPNKAYANAYWDGNQMVYGDANFYAADDVVGHEMSHGVTEHSSELFYIYESGAINESMSDIFGELIDQSDGINSYGGAETAAQKWLMGEDLNGGAIRSMSNPPLKGQPDTTQSPLFYTGPFDQGGVHFNSGVGNKAAYLIAAGGSFGGFTITALGNAKTSALYYEVNTTLLGSGANYKLLGAALIQACNNIRAGANPLGFTANDCQSVQNAVRATKMDIGTLNAINFAPKADICSLGAIPVDYLFNDDLESGFGNFTWGTLINSTPMPAAQAWQDSLAFFGPYAASGKHALLGLNSPEVYNVSYWGSVYESYVRLNSAITLPPESDYYLYFDHQIALEAGSVRNYDGAVLEYSVDGSGWQDAFPLFDSGRNYNGVIYNGYGNPLGGRNGFVRESAGYVSTRYNLKSLAGHTVNFRWVIGADDIGVDFGWFIDNIQVYQCLSADAAPERNYYTTPPTLTWTGISWATGYELEIAPNAAFTGSDKQVFGPGTLSYTVPAQPPGLKQRYWWRVRALKGSAAPGPWSAVESFTIQS
jgi:bacillolysin